MNKEAATITTTEIELIRNVGATRERIAQERATLRDQMLDLRRAGPEVEAEQRAEARRTHEEARGATARHAVALEAARRALRDLEARSAAGDETVTGVDVVAAREQVRLVEQRVKTAEAAEAKARRAWSRYAADDHLANLAADVLGTVAEAPILLRKDSTNLPAGLGSAIVLSQTKATVNYGTAEEVSGEVGVSLLGEPGARLASRARGLRRCRVRGRLPGGRADLHICGLADDAAC